MTSLHISLHKYVVHTWKVVPAGMRLYLLNKVEKIKQVHKEVTVMYQLHAQSKEKNHTNHILPNFFLQCCKLC